MSSLLYISILPVLIIWIYIYNKDKNKEPKKLLTKLFIFGVLLAFLTLFVSAIVTSIFPILGTNTDGLNKFGLFINVFIGTALIEELCKWIMVYKVSYKHVEYDEFYDMVVYAVAVSLGFALIENILYVFTSGYKTGIYRAFLAIPGHTSFGVFMGYFLSKAKLSTYINQNSKENYYKLLSIFIPTLLHGFYDYCLTVNETAYIGYFLIFVIVLDILTIIRIKKSSKMSFPKIYKDYYCPNCGSKITGNYCVRCGTRKNQ